MTYIPRLAVVPTHNRPAELARLIAAIAPQCDHLVIIDNASDPPVPKFEIDEWPAGRSGQPHSCWIKVVRDDEQPPNLSRLWNVGLNLAANLYRGLPAFDVAVLNDDAVPPPGWWDAVSGAMRANGAAAACSDPHGTLTSPLVKVQPDGDIMGRMCGWAFMLRGEAGLRVDERFRWWFGDTDLDWRARRTGGMVVVPGFAAGNTGANSSTVGVLAEQAGRDRETFTEVWGYAPW